MKPREYWNRKTDKRIAKKGDNGIVDLMMIINHFFGKLQDMLNSMKDPRKEGYCTYTQADYICMGLLKNICGQKTMTSMDEMFNEENCIDTLGKLSGHKGLDEMPHKDSLNFYLEKLDTKELASIRR